MPEHQVTVECAIFDSFRVQQVAGMFDVPLAARAAETFRVEVPAVEDDWQIGLITGPSGSGKTTVARAVFGSSLRPRPAWPGDRAVVDGFGDAPMKQIVGWLTAVGFSSPPSWIKPYDVLSGGEQFRCDLARALAEAETRTMEQSTRAGALVVIDEFTSCVDRQVAQVGAAAISQAIRSGKVAARLVAVTCHEDVRDWLAPDWTLDMGAKSLDWRRLRRPEIRLEVFRCHRDAWRMFARHHYLSGLLSLSAQCFLACWRGLPVAFCAAMPAIGRRNHWRITRIVTLPDFQGIGIGTAVVEAVAGLYRREGRRINLTASHPALVAHCGASRRWRTVRVSKNGSRPNRRFGNAYCGSPGRAVVSFEFVGEQDPEVSAMT